MTMELINKKHEDMQGRYIPSPAIRMCQNGKTRFNRQASLQHGLKAGLFVHLVREDKNWYLIIDSNEDGFKLYTVGDGTKSFEFQSITVVRYFLKETNHKPPCSFYIQTIGKKYKGKALIEILAAKPIERIGMD